MADASTTEFPVARCATCESDVLCHVDLDESDAEVLRCVACATRVDTATVRWLDLPELEELGWGFVLPEGGCGRPDCGNGRCGRAAPEDEPTS